MTDAKCIHMRSQHYALNAVDNHGTEMVLTNNDDTVIDQVTV